ncbi:hypothetical protein SAMN05444339_10454 [Loktanella atrilutea]|uniref:DUF2062 domain-containing protein n=1 Tax=Loktanella atrilutea TaxID=366533 RepID=A0A1M4ZN15_LOKAT|nr:DUF2062 domain-containing protein [Loktanella atrilutea]SHF19401.1 hypothetical protein SAMN05444339_10454 [Loktanella atrilutea]
MFKRRDKRPAWKVVTRALYPQGGWRRAFSYVKHRVRRLPDTPEKIGRGIWAGVFTTFTPFYGLHFIVAAIIAKLMRGNFLAALMATFFGNPLTYLPIAAVSLGTGHWLLGRRSKAPMSSLGQKFADAGADLWHNVVAIFTPETMDWQGLSIFYFDIFYPYMIGGILPGIVTATVAYYLSVPVLQAYQKRRRNILKAKLNQLAQPKPGDGGGPAAR